MGASLTDICTVSEPIIFRPAYARDTTVLLPVLSNTRSPSPWPSTVGTRVSGPPSIAYPNSVTSAARE
nr:hypothetical protein GCM10020092_004490 [Actinoplanes digitatis]